MTLVIVLSVLITACPPLNKRPRNDSSENANFKTVYMGSPSKIYEGAKLNPAVDRQFFEGTQSVYLFSYAEFKPYETMRVKTSATRADLQKGQTPEEQSVFDKLDSLKFDIERKENFIYLSTGDQNHFAKAIQIDTNKLTVELFESAVSTQRQYQILHTSLASDGELFSLLLKSQAGSEDASVLAMYFVKHFQPKRPPTLDRNLNYLYGPGVKVTLSRQNKIELNACGSLAVESSEFIRDQVLKWNHALQGLFQIEFSVANEYYPFTDLKQKCIYFVDDYLSDPREDVGGLGMTKPVLDYNKPEIIDSDIIVFKSEFEKVSKNSRGFFQPERHIRHTVLHELGHFLGLHHQFDDSISSVMSYREYLLELSDYDMHAIRSLYK